MDNENASLPYHLLTLKDGTEIALVGTAHVSRQSVQDVEDSFTHFAPDVVCLELDPKRFENMKDPDRWKKIDLVTALRQGQGFLLTANLILANYQRRMGQNLGIKPGAEMMRAAELAEQQNLPIALCDRSITATLTRAWRKCGFFARIKLLSALAAGSFSSEKISEEELARLRENDALSEMMESLAKEAPVIKEVLIDERDLYMAQKIYSAKGKRRLAVVGAGHMQGILNALQKLDNGLISVSTADLDFIPRKTWLVRLQSLIVPSLFLLLFFVSAFRSGSAQAGSVLAKEWLFWNIVMGALGGIIALANPIIILVNACVSPFSSLIPLISAGTVTALVQLWMEKPRIEDFEGLARLQGVYSWYRNRISHALIVWMSCSIGSSLGALIALGRISSITA